MKPVIQSGRSGTESELCAAIRIRLVEILKTLILEASVEDEEHRPPKVYNGWLPFDADEDTEVPYVIVRASKGKTTDNGFTAVTVTMMVMTYSKESDGHENSLQILHRIRQGLMSSPTLDNRYRMNPIFDWKLVDEQPWPNWYIELTTEWVIPTPQNIENEGDY